MSEMSSFYGGRQGASFVIVKRFDGIDIPQSEGNYTYTANIYAVDEDQNFIITQDSNIGNIDIGNGYYLIAKDRDNYTQYAWQKHDNDGSQINDSEHYFPSQLAEGMVQCFRQGAESSSEVNYGEYVIIDTMLNMRGQNDPDNGKVFRRGMDLNTDLAGAEYIGQIVGPQGESPELGIDHYDSIVEKPTHKKDSYTSDENDIVPGSYVENDERKFNDEIKYSWVTIRDEFGNVEGCLIGFKLPTLVQDFEARSISPYDNREQDPISGEYYNYDLITEDPEEYVDDKWKHPFYQKWQIKVPHGYHGVNSTNLEIIPTYTMPAGFPSDDFEGAKVWIDEALSEPYLVGGEQLVFTTSRPLVTGVEYKDNVDWAMVKYGEENVYVSREDCYMDVMRYRETNFDNVKEGEVEYFEIGDYDTIERVTISEDGTLTVFYSAKEQPQQLEQVLRWIDTKDTDGITIADDGTIRIYYNTLDTEGEHEYQEYPNVLDWITSVTLTQNGQFDVLYNNNTIQEGHYHTDLNWVDYIDIDIDGTINFYYNTNHNEPEFTFSKYIKVIDDVEIQTVAEGAQYEGTGDQKVHITYNTTDSEGQKETKVIGNPLNYIIETAVCIPTIDYPNVPYSHLLVYYSDPDLREQYRDKWVTYPSSKVIDEEDPETGEIIYHVWTQWVDLGTVRGAAGGIHIIKHVTSYDDLKDGQGNWIPPEQLTDSQGRIVKKDAAGWSCTLGTGIAGDPIEIVCYDYEDPHWYSIGTIDSAAIDPTSVIIKSEKGDHNMPKPGDTDALNKNGFWFAAEQATYAF